MKLEEKYITFEVVVVVADHLFQSTYFARLTRRQLLLAVAESTSCNWLYMPRHRNFLVKTVAFFSTQRIKLRYALATRYFLEEYCGLRGFRLPPRSRWDLRCYAVYSGNFLILQMGPIVCRETSIRNYHYMLRNISDERRSQHWKLLEQNKNNFLLPQL